MPRVTIGEGYTADSESLSLYINHLKARLSGTAKGSVEEREKERTRLHNKVMKTITPNKSGKIFVLTDYVENELGCSTVLIGYKEIGESFGL